MKNIDGILFCPTQSINLNGILLVLSKKTNLIEKHYWFDSIISHEVFFRVIRELEKNEKRKIYDGMQEMEGDVFYLCSPEIFTRLIWCMKILL